MEEIYQSFSQLKKSLLFFTIMKKGLKRTGITKRTLTNDFLHVNGANFFVQFYFEIFPLCSKATDRQPVACTFFIHEGFQGAFNGCDLLFPIIDTTRHCN